MSCEKHKIRSRSNCPDCLANSTKNEDKTSRDMLKDLGSKEEELVIQKEKKPRIKKEEIEDPNPYINIKEEFKELLKKEIDDIEIKIKALCKSSFEEYKDKINSLKNIRYEYQEIPLNKFNTDKLNKMSDERWRMVNIFSGVAKYPNMNKEDFVLMERIRK